MACKIARAAPEVENHGGRRQKRDERCPESRETRFETLADCVLCRPAGRAVVEQSLNLLRVGSQYSRTLAEGDCDGGQSR